MKTAHGADWPAPSVDTDSVCASVRELWRQVIEGGGPTRIAVLAALCGFTEVQRPFEPDLLAEQVTLLIERFADRRIPRKRLLAHANAIMGGLAPAPASSNHVLTDDNFGVIVCRLRRLLFSIVAGHRRLER